MAASYVTAVRTALAALCSSRTEQPRSSPPHGSAGRRAEEEEEEEEGPTYIPRKQAKNPMVMLGYAWMIGLPAGIIGFLLTKREVDKNRVKQLKVRQRMSRSNLGEYEGSRYQHHRAEEVKLDR
ncbi:hypothetical protein EYF80_041577 [Liparis tanakae]|uniref:Uncharacterized protein n=1 Tax=Liparis tanakae TaxID=230148 RepID=A0A4Z2G3W2_9TELE|nr:hypothetical protein EYF80_041577 [Liparis tanakae]